MKRLLPILVLLALVLASLSSCASSHEDLPKQTANEIPEQSITYTNWYFFWLFNIIYPLYNFLPLLSFFSSLTYIALLIKYSFPSLDISFVIDRDRD